MLLIRQSSIIDVFASFVAVKSMHLLQTEQFSNLFECKTIDRGLNPRVAFKALDLDIDEFHNDISSRLSNLLM
jgi:hypothetical protein